MLITSSVATTMVGRAAVNSRQQFHPDTDIEALGHLSEPRVAESLAGLRRVCADVRFLGSYPRANGSAATVPEEATTAAYAESRAWLDGLSH